PAAARMRDPVQTEVVHVVVVSAWMSQSRRGPSPIWADWPGPPGMRRMSGCGTSSKAASATRVRVPDSSQTRPVRSEEKITSEPGTWINTWCGPTASRAVKRSKRAMTICTGLLRAESAAVFGGADAQGGHEGAAHRLRGAVAAGAGGLLDAVGGVL